MGPKKLPTMSSHVVHSSQAIAESGLKPTAMQGDGLLTAHSGGCAERPISVKRVMEKHGKTLHVILHHLHPNTSEGEHF